MGHGQRSIAAVWFVHKIFGQWDALLEEEKVLEGFPYLDGMWLFARGSAYVGRGELGAAEEMLGQLKEITLDPALDNVLVMASPASTVLEVAAHGLEGEIKQARGDIEGAIAAFEEAVAIEDLCVPKSRFSWKPREFSRVASFPETSVA